jgi:hypothetical protein
MSENAGNASALWRRARHALAQAFAAIRDGDGETVFQPPRPRATARDAEERQRPPPPPRETLQ